MTGHLHHRNSPSRMLSPWLCFCLASALAAPLLACEQRTVPDNIDPQLELLVAGQVSTDLDILFVIDNTMSMGPWQSELVERFPLMIAGLREAEGGFPNVHIGVVSTDLGAGSQYSIPDCVGDGDDGILKPIDGMQCAGAQCAYIEDTGDPTCIDDDPELCRDKNYVGDITDAFRTQLNVGPQGCEYAEPLEAMRRALGGDGDNAQNPGFLRPNAALAVVIVADADDCSASDMALLDPMNMALGPPTRMRCFTEGVTCAESDLLMPGTKTGCAVNDQSQYLYPPSEYVAFLQDLKRESGQPVFFAAIGGDIDPISVFPHPMDGESMLMPSCSLDAGGPGARDAEPTIRLEAVAELFGANGQFRTLCDDDLTDALTEIANQLNDELQGTCLVGDLFDNDDVADGTQPGCSVIESDAQGENADYIELCPADGPVDGPVGTCFEITENRTRCSETDTGLLMVIKRDMPPRPGSVVAMACDVKQVTDGFVKTSYYGCSATGDPGRHPTELAWLLAGMLVLAARRRGWLRKRSALY